MSDEKRAREIAEAIVDANMEAIHQRRLSFAEARADLIDRIVGVLAPENTGYRAIPVEVHTAEPKGKR